MLTVTIVLGVLNIEHSMIMDDNDDAGSSLLPIEYQVLSLTLDPSGRAMTYDL